MNIDYVQSELKMFNDLMVTGASKYESDSTKEKWKKSHADTWITVWARTTDSGSTMEWSAVKYGTIRAGITVGNMTEFFYCFNEATLLTCAKSWLLSNFRNQFETPHRRGTCGDPVLLVLRDKVDCCEC